MSKHRFQLSGRSYELISIVLACVVMWGAGSSVRAESNPIGSLKTASVPEPSDWHQFVKDDSAAVALGKALFWDNEVGFDGQACASCHFHAGVDSRFKNALSPNGESSVSDFSPMQTGAGGPNYTLRKGDFPFFKLSDPEDRDSHILYDTDDVFSSMGVQNVAATNKSHPPTGRDDECVVVADWTFHVNGTNTRKVEPRNTPSTINAVFNHRQFWDGRANNRFNGVDPFGPRSPNAKVLKADAGGHLESVSIDLENASLAAQAVGPVLSTLEMNCADRLFKEVGRKLLGKHALETQKVSYSDSVLGSYANSDVGLSKTYAELVQAAFQDQWWSSSQTSGGFTQMESNFSLFFGLALQAYQATLISDDSPFDRFMDGDSDALSAQEIEGFSVFMGKGKCAACHDGPELSSAATHLFREAEEGGLVERMSMAKLISSGDSTLSADENLALGKVATQSSTAYGGVADRVVDGNTSGVWSHGSVNHTADEVNAWWQVDLGDIQSLGQIDILRRTDSCCTNRLKDFYVFASDTDLTGRSFADILADPSVTRVHYPGVATPQVSLPLLTSARFVRIQNGGTNLGLLNLAEVEIYTKRNLALGKSTTQSSTYYSSSTQISGDAEHAVDGNSDGHWASGSVTHTNLQANSWWQVDLGGIERIGSIDLYGRTDCCSNRLSNFYVFLSSHDLTGRSFNDILSDDSVLSFHIDEAVNPSVGLSVFADARYVRVQLAGSNWLSLAEVEIYAPDTFVALYDNGFYNIGVTPTLEDIGVGGKDPWGNPLSFTRQSKFRAAGVDQRAPDHFSVNPDKFEANSGQPVQPRERDAVDGSFKTPILRNLELTGPFFHNGGTLTLEQLVEFYNRGGDRQRRSSNSDSVECDTSGHTVTEESGVLMGDECSNLDPDIERLHLSDHEKDALVAFLKSLTDDRVRWESAPFDHPELAIPVGHVGDENYVEVKALDGGHVAADEWLILPAVGENGRGVQGLKPLAPVDDIMHCAESDSVADCFEKFYADSREPLIKIDIDHVAERTASGFIGLPGRPGRNVYQNGVTYTLFGFNDGSWRERNMDSDLLSDFVFKDGSGGVGLRINGLPEGRYRVFSWHYDADVNAVGRVRIEHRVFGDGNSVQTLVPRHNIQSKEPARYEIESNGIDTYELVFRVAEHRCRFNGIVIVPITDIVPGPTYTWSSCASEGQRCSFTGTRLVRYGANGVYVEGQFTDGVDCSNAVFGDPIYGVVKHCEIVWEESDSLVTLYEHSNFGGRSWTLNPGVYNFDSVHRSPLGNDRLTSFELPSGVSIRICEHDYGAGRCETYSSSVTNLSDFGMNDKMSSLEIFSH